MFILFSNNLNLSSILIFMGCLVYRLLNRCFLPLEEKPLLYEYYTNTLNPIIDRRGILGEEVDSHAGKRSIDIDSDRYAKRFFLERSRTLPTLQEQQQQKQQMVSMKLFDELCIYSFNAFLLLFSYKSIISTKWLTNLTITST